MVLKFPISAYAKGMVLLDDDAWFTKDGLFKAYSLEIGITRFYQAIADLEIKELNLLGVKLYQVGENWDFKRTEPILRYASILDLSLENFVEVFISKGGEYMELKTVGVKYPEWAVKINISPLQFSPLQKLQWRTLEKYNDFYGIKNKSRVYNHIKTGKAVAMDFIGKKNCLVTKILK